MLCISWKIQCSGVSRIHRCSLFLGWLTFVRRGCRCRASARRFLTYIPSLLDMPLILSVALLSVSIFHRRGRGWRTVLFCKVSMACRFCVSGVWSCCVFFRGADLRTNQRAFFVFWGCVLSLVSFHVYSDLYQLLGFALLYSLPCVL